MENGKYGEYAVTFTDANGNSYEVGVTRSAGTLTHIWFYNNGANLGTRTWKSAEITDTLCQSVYKNAKSIVTAMYSDTAIASGTCGYEADESGNSKQGDLSFYVVLENGRAYNFRYAIEDETFVHVMYEPGYDAEAAGGFGEYVVAEME